MQRRRGKGEGTVYRRNDGRWVAEIVVGRTASGSRRRVTKYCRTRGEAQDSLFVLRQKRHSSSPKLSLGDWLETWKAHVVATRRPSTALRYAGIVDAHCASVSSLRLSKITPDDIRVLYDELQRTGRSSATIAAVHAVLRSALAEAERRELIERNPVVLVSAPQHAAKAIQPMTIEEACAFLLAVKGDKYEALYAVAIATGLRLGEILGLRWCDIDLPNRSIHVRQQVVELVNGKLLVDAPLKTARGRRVVALGQIAMRPLVELARRPHDVERHVFVDSAGGPLRRTNFLAREFRPLLERAGIPQFNFHRLRHTAATLAKAAGADLLDVSRMLGHASTAITAAVYVDLFLEGKRAIATGVDGLLTGRGPETEADGGKDGTKTA